MIYGPKIEMKKLFWFDEGLWSVASYPDAKIVPYIDSKSTTKNRIGIATGVISVTGPHLLSQLPVQFSWCLRPGQLYS